MKVSCLLSRFFTVVVFFLVGLTYVGASPIQDSRQLVVSVSDGWWSHRARLSLFEHDGERWQKKLSFAATIGRNGLGWGQGLHNAYLENPESTPEPIKVEGDGKAPAGVFALVQSFGYQSLSELTFANENLPEYHKVDEHSRCVDDYQSNYYNNNVYDQRRVHQDWSSFEYLKRSDDLYKYALVVDHNRVNVSHINRSRKRGSCIFLHLWRGPNRATAGCTAFSESNMRKLLARVDARKSPLLVQLPEEKYREFQLVWGLPSL